MREPQIGLKDRTQTPALDPLTPLHQFPPDNPTPDGNAEALQGFLEEILNLTVSPHWAKPGGRNKSTL